MKKMNKKGFTLIEMLVVIAIIAILVAIVIPVVTNSTKKAAAATNAANLRSLVAEASTDFLAGVNDSTGMIHTTIGEDGTPTFTVQASAPKSKAVAGTINADIAATVTFDATSGTIVAKYGEKTVADFSALAEGKNANSSTGKN